MLNRLMPIVLVVTSIYGLSLASAGEYYNSFFHTGTRLQETFDNFSFVVLPKRPF